MLLPILGVISSAAATVGEVLFGVGTVSVIGAGIKGAIDLKDASDYQDVAEYKLKDTLEKTKKEVSKTQDQITAFAKLKVKAYNGVLKKAVKFLQFHADSNPERIKHFTETYKTCVEKFSGRDPHTSIGLDYNCSFCGNDFEFEDFIRIALGGPVGFLITSSEKLTEAIQANAEADVQCELLKSDMKTCKAIRKRISEGTKLVNALTIRLNALISYGPSAAVAILPMAESLLQIIDVDLIDKEGRLIDSSVNLYRIKMREVLE